MEEEEVKKNRFCSSLPGPIEGGEGYESREV
jgi:hypothetical protein